MSNNDNTLNSFTLRRAEMRDYSAIFDLMLEAFTETEPVAIALNVTREQAVPYVKGFIEETLPQGFSIVLEHAGIVVGTFLMRIVSRGTPLYEEAIDPTFSPNVYQLELIARSVSEGIWDLLPQHCQRGLHGMYCVVSKNFMHRGGALLLEHKIHVAREEKVDFVFAECINNNSVKVLRRLGCIIARSIPYSAWKDKEGQQLVRHPKHSSAQLLIGFLRPTVTRPNSMI